MWVTTSYILGISLAKFVFDSTYFPIFILLSLFTLTLIIYFRQRHLFSFLSIIFVVLFGIIYFWLYQNNPIHSVANPKFHQKGYLEGKVISPVEEQTKGKRRKISFVVEAYYWWIPEEFSDQEENVSSLEEYSVQGKVRISLVNPRSIPEYGDRIRVAGKLDLPKKGMNPGEFNYRNYLNNKNIKALFLGVGKKNPLILSHCSSSVVLRNVFRLRQAIHDQVYALIQGPKRDILLSLITGERKNIPREISEDFVKTGTIHVLAISGFQVSLVAGFTFVLFLKLRCSLHVAALFAAFVLLLYVPLAGWQLPVQRAGVMGLVVMGSIGLKRSSDITSSLFLALFVLLLINPHSLFSVSFQLSFISVVSLICFVSRLENLLPLPDINDALMPAPSFIKKSIDVVKGTLLATLAASLGTWPLILYYFNVVSFTSVLANTFIVPLTTLALFMLIFVLMISLICFPLAKLLMFFPSLCIDWSVSIAHWIAKIPFGYLYCPSPSLIWILIYYVSLLVFVLNLFKLKKYLYLNAAIFLFSVIVMLAPLIYSKHEITFLQIPKTMVVYVQENKNNNLLINAGQGKPKNNTSWMTIPYLKSQGVSKIFNLLLTSDQGSFWSGASTLEQYAQIKQWLFPNFLMRKVKFRKVISDDDKKLKRLNPGDELIISKNIKIIILNLFEEQLSEKYLFLDFIIQYYGKNILVLSKNSEPFISDISGYGPIDAIYVDSSILHSKQTVEQISQIKAKSLIYSSKTHEEAQIIGKSLSGLRLQIFDLSQTGALKGEAFL